MQFRSEASGHRGGVVFDDVFATCEDENHAAEGNGIIIAPAVVVGAFELTAATTAAGVPDAAQPPLVAATACLHAREESIIVIVTTRTATRRRRRQSATAREGERETYEYAQRNENDKEEEGKRRRRC